MLADGEQEGVRSDRRQERITRTMEAQDFGGKEWSYFWVRVSGKWVRAVFPGSGAQASSLLPSLLLAIGPDDTPPPGNHGPARDV